MLPFNPLLYGGNSDGGAIQDFYNSNPCCFLREKVMLPDEWNFAGFPNGVKLKQQAGWPRETRFMSWLQGMDWCGVHAHRAWTDRVCATTPAFKWHSRYAHWIGDRITRINGGIVNSSVNLCKRYSTPQKIYIFIRWISRFITRGCQTCQEDDLFWIFLKVAFYWVFWGLRFKILNAVGLVGGLWWRLKAFCKSFSTWAVGETHS